MTENNQESVQYDFQVQGLVAMLDESHTSKVKALWQQLEVQCGLTAIYATPYPHFSFHIAERYDLDVLDGQIKQVIQTIRPFKVRTAGISFFTGPSPVVFIPVIVTHDLLSIHRLLWEGATDTAENLSPYYGPGNWVPHITLANKDVNIDNLGCLTGQLVGLPFAWEIEINEFAVICQEDGHAEIHQVYSLGTG